MGLIDLDLGSEAGTHSSATDGTHLTAISGTYLSAMSGILLAIYSRKASPKPGFLSMTKLNLNTPSTYSGF